MRLLPEGSLVSPEDLHRLRKEFLERVFTFYILRFRAGLDEEETTTNPSERRSPTNAEEQEDASPVPAHPENEAQAARRILAVLNRLDPKAIFSLYKKLSVETRDRLDQKGLLPESSAPEAKGRQSEHYHASHQSAAQKNEHVPLKQIVSKLIGFLSRYSS